MVSAPPGHVHSSEDVGTALLCGTCQIPWEPAAELRSGALLRLPPGPRGTAALPTRRGPGRSWPASHCPLLASREDPALWRQPDVHLQVG